MALLHLPLDDITEAHLAALIENGARESLYIDYKRQTYGRDDAAKKEFLADVSSFANAAGGDIVIGIEEGTGGNKGIPVAIKPFTDNADDERLRLEQMARDGIEPRISGLRVHIVPTSKYSVFVIRVPKSYNPPHRVKLGGSNRFYARSSGGKYEPNVEELRNLFLAAPHLHERIRAFRMERIARIAANETPVPLSPERPRRFVLHIVPYSAFNPTPVVSFADISARAAHGFHPPACSGIDITDRVNFDGRIAFLSDQCAYTQLFRSGIVEYVFAAADVELTFATTLGDNRELLTNAAFVEQLCADRAQGYTGILNGCGIAPPYVILASLIGMDGARFVHPPQSFVLQDYPTDRDQYHFIESVFETLPKNQNEAIVALAPTLDQMASLVRLDKSHLVENAKRALSANHP